MQSSVLTTNLKMKLLTPHPKKFTTETYHKMSELGLFPEGDRLELIKGEIIEMSPVGLKHASCVKRLNHLFMKKLGDQVIVGVQDPIQLEDNSEPQPDLVLLKPRSDFYGNEHPQPKDILLLIEVSDSSLEYDRTVKIPLYAENQISEVWLVDLNESCLEIYRKPYQNYYQNTQKLSHINSIILSNFPEFEIKISDLF
jgi:Uma2 family endonuclease